MKKSAYLKNASNVKLAASVTVSKYLRARSSRPGSGSSQVPLAY